MLLLSSSSMLLGAGGVGQAQVYHSRNRKYVLLIIASLCVHNDYALHAM